MVDHSTSRHSSSDTVSCPVAAALLSEIDRQRLEAMAVHAGAAAATGQLTVSEDECRDVLWSTIGGSL